MTQNTSPSKTTLYFPLVALGFVSVAMAEILHLSFGLSFMSLFMGFLLVNFGLVKLFDLDAFVERFRQYDLISSRVILYGYLFPFIEMGIGFAYLGNYNLMTTSWVMLMVGTISLLGILKSLRKGEKLKCACMGTSADMPLGTVTVIENGLMIAMAALYLIGMH